MQAPLQAQAQAPQAPVFTLGPGCNDNILDWINVAHTKQHYKATAPLDISEKFNEQQGKSVSFYCMWKDCAQPFNWNNIMMIPVGATNYSLIHDYSCMMLQDMCANALNCMGQEVHDAQNSYMLYLFIIKLLMDMFKVQVLLYKEDYTVMLAGGSTLMKAGPTLLKRVIMLT